MQQLNSRTILLIQNSEWFRPYALEFLRLHECRKPYEILERIWLNVSSKCGRSWKDIYNAKQVNCELFAERSRKSSVLVYQAEERLYRSSFILSLKRLIKSA